MGLPRASPPGQEGLADPERRRRRAIPYLLVGDFLCFLDDAKERLGTEGFERVARRLEQELRGLVQNLSPLGERALVDGFLEHFLERDDLRSVFESWRTEPTLARLYLEADERASSIRARES